MDNDFELPEEPNAKGYTVKIDEQLFKRLEKHIKVLKRIEQTGISKQTWITDAIKEKLAKDKDPGNMDLPKERHLTLKINDPINEKIDAKVNILKQLQASYSKKKWLLEAIYEKLESEEPKTKQYLEDLISQIKR